MKDWKAREAAPLVCKLRGGIGYTIQTSSSLTKKQRAATKLEARKRRIAELKRRKAGQA